MNTRNYCDVNVLKGKHYPCKPDIFEMTYEVAE